MSRAKIKSADRVLSLILTVLMVLTMIPVSSLQAFAATIKNPDKLTVTVDDGTAAPVEGASVKITASGEVVLNLEGTTDADGETAFDPAEIKTLMETAGVELVKATLSVEKEGFVKYENEIDIKAENLAENHDVVLEAEDTATATVTVTVTGSATVELNGVVRNTITVDAGTEVAVKITPAADSYIKSLTVGGEAASVEKYNAYEATIKADNDVEIVAAVVKECVVTVKKNEGGSVYIGGNEVTGETYTLDAGSNVVISAKAAEGYVLSSVNIGGGNFLGFEGKSEFSGSFGISRNITVTVNFIKVHTIKVEHSANGTVVTNPVAAGNVISILDGKNVIIEATPEANFRVSEVTVNGVNEDVSGENNSGYKKEFAADGDYTIFITFAPNVFKVTAAETVNGAVSIGADVVEYGKNDEITVTPEDGYSVSSVKVNGVAVEEYTTDEDGSVIFTIKNITEDKEIVAEFVETAKCDVDYKELFNDEDAIRNPGMTYIYKNGGFVTFTTDKEGIILYDAEGNVIAGGNDVTEVTVESNTEIAKIALRYKAQGEMAVMSHALTSVTSENELRIVFDKTAPTASVTPDEANSYGYYNKDVNVIVSAEDAGYFSGIYEIKYQIKCDDVVTQDWTTLYDYNPEEGISDKVENKQFTVVVNEETNNSDNVQVIVQVTDLAGNVITETKELKTNCTPPKTEISFIGTAVVDNIYNSDVSVTIEYEDRASTFNRDAVFNAEQALSGIVIEAKDAAGNAVDISRVAMVSIDETEQMATITFTADANYSLTVNYTNKAGMSAEEIKVDFTVDKTAPEAKISLLGNSWNTLLETLTFGLYSANVITATVEATDATTSVPAENILYYVSYGDKTYTQTELEELYDAGEFSAELNTVGTEERFVIYARVSDTVDNVVYVGTDGAVYDCTKTNIGLYVPVANRYGFYNSDVEIGISVSDGDKGSGIKTVEYSITADGTTTKEWTTLYSFDMGEKVPEEKDLLENWTGKIKVIADENNADNVQVTVKVTDNAGNVSEEYVRLSINSIAPSVEITFNDDPVMVLDGRGYFRAEKREGIIRINDRNSTFNSEAASAGVTVVAKDANGNEITADYTIGEWKPVEPNVHEATITFNQGANYDWSYSYTNNADMTSGDPFVEENTDTPFCFTVDSKAPEAKISLLGYSWNTLLETLTFGLYSADMITATVDATDATTSVPAENILYYVAYGDKAYTQSELEYLYGDGQFSAELTVSTEERFVIYARVADIIDNAVYIGTDGAVYDNTDTVIGLYAPVANRYGFYNSDVDIGISVSDGDKGSGIKTVEYSVTADGVTTQSAVLYSFDYVREEPDENGNDTNGGKLTITDWDSAAQKNTAPVVTEGKIPSAEDLKVKWTGKIKVIADNNNADDVRVTVKVTDNAGKVSKESVKLSINSIAPSVEVAFDDEPVKVSDGRGYFRAEKREGTITINDRNSTFNAETASAGVTIVAKDANGKELTADYTIGKWDPVGPNVYKATITFNQDANYEWSYSYTNKADMTSGAPFVEEETDTPFSFTVDSKAPEAKVSLLGNSWNTLLETLTFGLYSADVITATVEATDATTSVPVENILYFVSYGDKAYTEAELIKLYNDGKFSADQNTVNTEERFAIYARVSDTVGNAVYIDTDGAVYDNTDAVIGLYAPVANRYGFYNSDVEIGISVSDGEKGSGIKTIEYSVTADGVTTQSAVLYSFDYVREEPDENGNNTNGGKLTVTDWDSVAQKNTDPVVTEGKIPAEEDLKVNWTGKIKVIADNNNADDVRVTVKVTDNAGNVSEESVKLSINSIAPTVEITFDDKPVKVSDGRGYFGAEKREGTITINDRNSTFNAEAASAAATVVAKDAKGKEITADYTIGEWKLVAPNVHKATITFNQEANYDWSYSYTNKADMTSGEPVVDKDTDTPYSFTVDMVAPYGSVSVDEYIWNKILSTLTFGIYKSDAVKVSTTMGDNTSPTSVAYYVTNDTILKEAEELDKIAFGKLEDFDLNSDNACVVYVKITDYAGNYSYIYSDGFIIDSSASEIILDVIDSNNKDTENTENKVDVDLTFNSSEAPRVTISVKEPDSDKAGAEYSGIKSIKYWIYPNNDESNITQSAELYSFKYVRDGSDDTEDGKLNTNGGELTIVDWDSETQQNTKPVSYSGAYPKHEQLRSEWSGYVDIIKEKNNYSVVTVKVEVTDNAGNEKTEYIDVDIDIVVPTIEVTFNNNEDNNGNGYFKDNDNDAKTPVREATVVITERTDHFTAPVVYFNSSESEENKAVNNITIIATNSEGKKVEDAYEISKWTTVDNLDDPDAATHTATITFKEDANYSWSIDFSDDVGNKCEDITTGDSVVPFNFTIDTAEPDVTMNAVSYENNSEKRKEVWDNKFGDELIFGFWSNDEIRVNGTAKDDTSAPIASVEYYKVKAEAATDGVDALDYEALEKVTDWKKCTVLTDEKGLNAKFDVLSVTQDEQFVVYLKVTDMAGNYRYVHSDGLIVDHTAPSIESIAPEITIEPVQPINGLYNDDVKVSIKVEDPLTGGTYSGLKTVKYKIYNMGKETQTGTLYTFDKEYPVQADLVQSISREITVDSELNNSNDVEIEVYAQDNSLNAVTESEFIKIDISKPEIVVSYDNNNADSESYFKADRVATVDIYERNFKAEDVKFTITNTDDIMPMISEWTKTEGTGNLDDTKWTATIAYIADGDYTFDVQYTDLANNKADDPDYGNSVAPTAFTVDKTLPVINVSYDNNSAKNGKYFAEERTATIVVTEHNFILDRVEFTQTASLNGEAIAIPEAAWTHEGDVHTAVIKYPDDGDYTFDVKVTDMAGNVSEEADYGDSVAGKDFVVDLTIEKPVISGIENGCAYKEDVIPAVSVKDINFDTYTVKLYRTRLGEINADVTAEFIGALTEEVQGASGSFDTFEKIVENDGIYTLVATVLDKAGNEDKTSVTFSVNRFGSVYCYSDYLVSLIKDGGQYVTVTEDGKPAVHEDLIITEYNADKLLDNSLNILITRDGKTIDAEVTPKNVSSASAVIGAKGWYEYQYVISKSNFAEDGVYRITLTSEYATVDSEKNESSSVPENSFTEGNEPIVDTMSFTVDTVAPEIRNIINLEKAIINETKVEVKYTIVDVGGLKSIVVLVDGKEVSRIENFEDGGFNYSGLFELFENKDESKAKNKYEQNVRIVVTDLAGNVTDTAAEDFSTGDLYEFNKDVTISTNLFVRWYANKLLFWGSVGGTVVLAAALLFIIIIIKRKKDKEN